MKSLSASNIHLFLRCPRQWYLTYKWGWKGGDSPASALGTAIHAEQERFYLTGEMPSRPNAVLALNYAPPRSPDVAIETKVENVTISGIPVRGRIDLTQPGLVIDWKTTKSKRWAKTEEDLKKDAQSILYAQDHRLKYGVAPLVRLVYINTGDWGAPTWKVEHQWTDASLDAALVYIEKLVALMRGAYQVENITDLPCLCKGNHKICAWDWACDL